MAVKIRLKRLGKVRAPHYRIVVADSRTKRDGRVIEEIGRYIPTENPSFIEVNSERARYWLGVGAQPTEQVEALLKLTGDYQFSKGDLNAKNVVQVNEKILNGGDAVEIRPEISNPILSQQTVSQLNTMLINVVDNGFNKVAKIPGYYFAGKTGTAQVPLKNGNGYEADKTIQSFVGYGPALNPQFLILVKLDNPKVPKSSLSAVPVFKKLANYIINYWQIPPDYDVNAE
ncbi:MAG: 30S ribosomal protein S16 [Candidatus Staskawiczbacteria bacterium]